MKKVLLTGSEGYIGQHLIKLLNNKFKIFKLDINSKINPIDIRNKINIDDHFDVVVHLAALVSVGESVNKPYDYFLTNVEGTNNVLNLNYNNFIFASTGAVEYASNPYSLSKKMCEYLVENFCKNNNKNYTIFRFYNVLGSDNILPTNLDGLFANLIRAEQTGIFNLYGDNYNTRDGSCIRDFIHVYEVCEAILKAIDHPSNSIECLGHGQGTSIKEAIAIYKKVNNCDFNIKIHPRRSGDIESSILKNVSPYMNKIFNIEKLFKRP